MVYVPNDQNDKNRKNTTGGSRNFRIISGSEMDLKGEGEGETNLKDSRKKNVATNNDLILGDEELGFDYEKWQSGEWRGGWIHVFPHTQTEIFFWNEFERKHQSMIKLFIIVLTLGILFCIPAYDLQFISDMETRVKVLLVRCCQLILGLFYGILFMRAVFDSFQMESLFIFNCIMISLWLTVSAFDGEPNHGPYVAYMLVVHLFCGLGNKLSFFFCVFTSVAYAGVAFMFSTRLISETVSSLGYLFIIVIMSTFMGQFLELKNRENFFKKHKLRLERARSDMIVNTVLPPSVAVHLKKGKHFAKEYKSTSKGKGVSVMFIQICDFEEMVSDLTERQVVTFLNNIFTHFDTLTDKWDVFKVETVMEVYMVASGLPEKCINKETQRPDHARRLADLAIDCKKNSAHLLNFAGKKFQIRIGCNSGTVIAGVIGRKLPRYRLIGDTVNVASRMESTALPGTIQCTKVFYDLLPSRNIHYKITKRENVKVKGKGEMTVYVIEDGLAPRHDEMINNFNPEEIGDFNRPGLAKYSAQMDVLSFLQQGRKIHAQPRVDLLKSKYQSEFMNIKRESTTYSNSGEQQIHIGGVNTTPSHTEDHKKQDHFKYRDSPNNSHISAAAPPSPPSDVSESEDTPSEFEEPETPINSVGGNKWATYE